MVSLIDAGGGYRTSRRRCSVSPNWSAATLVAGGWGPFDCGLLLRVPLLAQPAQAGPGDDVEGQQSPALEDQANEDAADRVAVAVDQPRPQGPPPDGLAHRERNPHRHLDRPGCRRWVAVDLQHAVGDHRAACAPAALLD